MALTPASVLADYSSGIGTQGATLQIKTEDQRVGIGTTNPQGTLQVGTAITMGSGIVTATSFDANTATFSGNISVGGTLTYEDVTSVDSVGIITARSNVIVGGGLSVTGISTFNGITTSTTTLFANDFSVSGVSTLGGNVVVGGATTELVVTGDARVTGILTVGTASLTLNGTTGAITGGSLTNAQVAAIDSSISDTAVDVFVYDTRKDSDGGAWRHRTQHTSWYNETLGTATRGTRKEFPAVAVIVSEENKVTIYDGDDPDLPMWMVLNEVDNGNALLRVPFSGDSQPKLSALNGIVSLACNDSRNGFIVLEFVKDSAFKLRNSNEAGSGPFTTYVTLSLRNTALMAPSYKATKELVNTFCNDVSMTVLPNAPIDDATGLPIPTIAVATNGGVSIIKDDGTVVDMTRPSYHADFVEFIEYNGIKLLCYLDNNGGVEIYSPGVFEIPNSDVNFGDVFLQRFAANNFPTGIGAADSVPTSVSNSNIDKGNSFGLSRIYLQGTDFNSQGQSSVAYITSDYNTGWMHGDIKGAFLSGISTANVTGSELVTNGTFANTNGSSVSSWTDVSIGTGTISEGSGYATLNRVDGGNTGRIAQDMSLISGKQYTLSFDLVAGSTSGVQLRQFKTSDNSLSGTFYNYVIGSGVGTKTFNFVCEDGFDGWVLIPIDSTNTFTRIDNFSVKQVEEDRSVNNNPLQVFGTVTKSAVATGADLVAYSGFSASNYLEQPYNSDLAPGTNPYSVMVWVKTGTSSGDQYIFDRASGETNTRNILLIRASGAANPNRLQWWHRDTSGNSTDVQVTDLTVTDNNWHHVVAVQDGGGYFVYVDGVKSSIGGGIIRDIDNSNSPDMYIGVRNSLNNNMTGSMALFRYSLSCPSPEQVKKIYEDEKVLFQENAKATLYGSSDAVTALGYDDDEETLYVGTSSGRSDFRGLRRINNTTTAVTTAISASNGLVAEQ